VSQSVISAYESGHREPSYRVLKRLVEASGGRLVADFGPPVGLPDSPLGRRLRQRRQRVLDLAERYGVTDVRVFGSVARGEDGPDSDVDLLVDVPEGYGLFRLLGFEAALEAALGVAVEVVPANRVGDAGWEGVLAEAVPL
jgi:predicted nucleotidyltransferase